MRVRTLLLTLALCSALGGLAATALAAVPSLINYQGKLTDNSGAPITSAVTLKFRIYDAPTGGTLLWGPESHPTTPDANGIYNVILGAGTPPVPFPANLFADASRYLGVEVNADGEMTPRQQITAVAYSLRVATVDGATGGTISGDVSIASDLSVSGKATIGPGHTNTGPFAFVAGANNRARGAYSVVSGGGGTAFGLVDSNSAIGDYSTIGGGLRNTAIGTVATVGGGQNNTASGEVATVGGGLADTASGHYSIVSGGFHNVGSGDSSVIGGGSSNRASALVATVGGGQINTASATGATVGGGGNNRARGQFSTVAGGGGAADSDSNSASGNFSAIGGGRRNTASASSTVGGGESNTASNSFATVGGGGFNKARGAFSVVGGGGGGAAVDSNSASGSFSAIGGGRRNIASGSFSTTVGGGESNTASASGATVGGGGNNKALGSFSVISGGGGSTTGDSNVASGGTSAIGGGFRNTASGSGATVSGGSLNTASNSGSMVGGGSNNTASGINATVGGGNNDTASGGVSTVPGGSGNTARGDFSLAAGRRAKANHAGAFVWADDNSFDFASTAAKEFSARTTGGARFVSAIDGLGNPTAGVTLAAGGNAWAGISDSTKKRNIRLVDTKEILAKVVSLPVKRWSFKSQDPKIEHIGPMAQDFYALFGVGEDDKTISTIDPPGIALAAIQELHKVTQEQRAEINGLKAQVSELQELVQTLLAERQEKQASDYMLGSAR